MFSSEASQTSSAKTFSKASLFRTRQTSKLKYTPIEGDFSELNPYADGEWMQLKTKEDLFLETGTSLLTPDKNLGTQVDLGSEPSPEIEEKDEDKVMEKADEDEKSEVYPYKRDNILRGPIWNYGVRKISSDKDYYNHVLFGIPWTSIETPEDMIIKGKTWIPEKNVKTSLAIFILRKLRKLGYEKTSLVEMDSGRSLSYGELCDRVESLASGLLWLGVQQEQIIAIVSYHSLEAHVMLLASLLIGAVPALVDSSLNAVDLGIVLRTTSPHLLFTEAGKTLHNVEAAISYLEVSLHTVTPKLIINSTKMGLSTKYLLYHQLLREVNPDEPIRGPHKANPLRPIMILYTGAIDNLRACLVSERYFTFSKAFMTSVLPESDEPSITVMVTLPMYCAPAMKSVLNHYIDGHRIIMCRGPTPEPCLLTALHKFEVFAMLTIRSTLISLLDWPARPRCPHLKLVGITGVPLRLKNLNRVITELFKNQVKILQLYGLVETGVTAANTFLDNKYGSVGKLFYNVDMKVLQEGTGIPLGCYEEGELCVRAPTMMLGYIHNLDANSELIDSEGFIHTGDLGYYDDQGYVFITDQVREIIKYRTYLVSPSLVEEVLLEQPEVKEALVFGLFDEEDGELVSAAIVFEAGYEETDVQALEKQVNAALPIYRRIRGGIYVFNQFPRSTIGKPVKDAILKEVKEMKVISQRRKSLEG